MCACVKHVGGFLYIWIYMFCLSSFVYVCLQTETKTAKQVGIDFHQPLSCSELCPCSPPAACTPVCSAAAGCCHTRDARTCWWDADVAAALAHATIPPRVLGRAMQLSAAWAADGACRGITCSSREMQTWGFTLPLCALLWGREGALAHRLCLSWDHSSCTQDINTFLPLLLYFHTHSEYEQATTR